MLDKDSFQSAPDIEDDQLDSSIRRLNFFARQLRSVGFVVTMASSFLLVIVAVTFLNLFRSNAPLNREIYPLIAIAVLTANLFLLVMRDSLKKRGDALFEELSDELQWHALGKISNEKLAESRPRLSIRVALRTYARTTDLPLVPGRYGEAVYAAFSIAMFFVAGFASILK